VDALHLDAQNDIPGPSRMAGPPRGILPDGSVPVLLVFAPCYALVVLFLFPLMLVPFLPVGDGADFPFVRLGWHNR
jgi:hypothetical protein